MDYHALNDFFFSFLCLTFYCDSTSSFPLSLSLSLSLSLAFSLLIITPKKSVLSKNLVRRGSSSSSSSSSFPFDSIQFHDEKAWHDFFENFFDRVIHLKR